MKMGMYGLQYSTMDVIFKKKKKSSRIGLENGKQVVGCICRGPEE